MRIFIAAVAVFTTASPAVWAAGVRVQSESTDLRSGAVTKIEMLLDQARMRVNITGGQRNSAVLFLTDGGRDRMVMLDPAKNEYMEIDKAGMDQMAAQMEGMMSKLQEQMSKMPPEQRAMMEKMMKGGGLPGMPGGAGAAPKPAPTVYAAKGSGSANGFACTKYEGTQGGVKVAEVCAAKPAALKFTPTDFAVFERMKQFTAGMQAMAAKSPFAGMTPAGMGEAGLDGLPVTQTHFADGKAIQKIDVKSVERAAFTGKEFSLGDAKKREMPVTGGRPR